jgi:hypothetical protein
MIYFLNKKRSRSRREKEEMLGATTTATTTKPTTRTVIFVLVAAAAVLFGGYITALAVLAPEQLAEATAAATDVVCSGCVGTTDIASSAVTSAKIGSGQVANSDIATNAVTGSKISDTSGVASVDIVNGQVTSNDIADGTIKHNDIASGTLIPSLTYAASPTTTIAPGGSATVRVDCLVEQRVTGGGFNAGGNVRVVQSRAENFDTWVVQGVNAGNTDQGLAAYAICMNPIP